MRVAVGRQQAEGDRRPRADPGRPAGRSPPSRPRGVDVGSIEFIHRQLVDQRDAGVGVLLVSAELDEILSLSDRVAVIYEGRIQAVMPVAEATRERIGLLMAGADPDQVDIPDNGLNEADRPTL